MGASRRGPLKLLAVAAACPAWTGTGLAGGEAPPETTRIRLSRLRSVCVAPQYVAAELLRGEGFTEIKYTGEVISASGLPGAQAMGAGQVDMAMNFAATLMLAIDQGVPIVLLAGVHSGCFELFGGERVLSINRLRGKKVAILNKGSAQHVLLASIATSVGIDPNRDIDWVDYALADSKRLLAEGKLDAYLGFSPDPQELRATQVGHVLLNSAVDRPWSQYFCCLVAANKEFVRKYPVAAKRATRAMRAMRAILKAGALCASDSKLAVKAFVAPGYDANPEYAREAIRGLPCDRWLELDPEETVRFYAVRQREAEMAKGAPQKLIAQRTDWRILEQLKREMTT